MLLGVAALVVALVGSAWLWSYLSSYESTDDAEVDGHLNLIGSRIAGTVVGVYVEDNQFVKPGQRWWTWIRPGQWVDVRVDAFDRTFHGYVESMPGSTGARASLLPPENATGNYVKVLQRLPVRIRLKPDEDPQHRLRIGMSVGPKIWLNSNTK